MYTRKEGLPEVTRAVFFHNSGRNGSMRAVCEQDGCCSSFTDIQEYDEHCRRQKHGWVPTRDFDTIKVYQIFETSERGKSFFLAGNQLYNV